MKNYYAAAMIKWYNGKDEDATEYILLSEVEDFADAAKRIEKAYGHTLISMELELFTGPFIDLNQETFERFKNYEV